MQQTAVRAHRIKRVVSLAWSLGLAGLALLLLGRWVGWASAAANPAAPSAPAVTFVVTATADSGDNNLADHLCHDVLNGGCSLRAAVQQLDDDSGGTINLPAGTFNLTSNGDGDLQLQKDIKLLGAGPNATTIQGDPSGWAHRILRVQDGASVLIGGVTISNGQPAGVGGGIDVVSGSLTLSNSLVTSNTAASYGGGIYNTGQLSIIDSTIRENTALTNGGGLYNEGVGLAPGAHTDLTVTTSSILSNTAIDGGGLYNDQPLNTSSQVFAFNASINGNHASQTGGGVFDVRGPMTLINTRVSGNTAFGAGGLENDNAWVHLFNDVLETNRATGGDGGGIASQFGRLDITISTIQDNRAASGLGGGVVSQLGTLNWSTVWVISNTAVLGGGLYSSGDTGALGSTAMLSNHVPSLGGGLYAVSSALTLTASVFDGNSANSGGGIGTGGTARLVISATTLSNNQALNADGGGLLNNSGSAVVDLVNSTVSGNQTTDFGGGIANVAGTVDLSNVTVAGNTADSDHNGTGDGGGVDNESGATLRLRNTLLAGNSDKGGEAPDCKGTLDSKDYNLVQSILHCTLTGSLANNILNKNPLLGPLQSNGSLSLAETRALAGTSPGIDAGNPAGCKDFAGHLLATDERLHPRPLGSACDIGAYEAARLLLPVVAR